MGIWSEGNIAIFPRCCLAASNKIPSLPPIFVSADPVGSHFAALVPTTPCPGMPDITESLTPDELVDGPGPAIGPDTGGCVLGGGSAALSVSSIVVDPAASRLASAYSITDPTMASKVSTISHKRS